MIAHRYSRHVNKKRLAQRNDYRSSTILRCPRARLRNRSRGVTQVRKGNGAAVSRRDGSRLSDSVRDAMERYFTDLDGQDPGDLYDLVMSQVERPLFEIVMENTRGNISRAAQLLGLNRATLRSRLRKYGLD
jgi:Fis family transcriptional regulator